MKKIVTILVIFTIVSLSLVVFLVYPLFKEIKKNSEELILEKRKLISLETEIKNLEEFKKIYQLLELNLERADKLLINPDAPVDFIKFLEKTAIDSKVLIKISPISSKTTETDIWSSLEFQTTLTGSFPDFLKFLEKIEYSPYLIEISNLGLRGLTENDLIAGINGTLLMKVYTK